MYRWHGRTICDAIAIVLLGVEMAENSVTFVGDSNIWSFVHKMYMFTLGLHCAHEIFYQIAKWSNSQCDNELHAPTLDSLNLKWLKPCCILRQMRSTRESKLHGKEKLKDILWQMRVVFHQLPLAVLIILAVFHSISGTYFFYRLTGFVRQNNIKVAGWYTYIITHVDILSIAVIFLWFRWGLVFYNYEAKQFRRKEHLWRKIFCSRWRYPVQCILGLSVLQMGLTLLKLMDGVPFIKTETLYTSVTQGVWFLHVFLVTAITFLSCFPHAVCQVSAIMLSFVGFFMLSATPAEIHAELYGILYLFIPSALAIAAMLYHTIFSPGIGQALIWTKRISQVLTLVFFTIVLVMLVSERRAFDKYVVHTNA